MTEINLLELFKSASSTLNKNKEVLNAEDTFNHNHGDNMAETFSVITQAMKEKADLPAWQQLAYASDLLRSKTQSGSGSLYAKGLAAASTQFKGKKVNETNVVNLIQTMMAAGVKPKPLPVEKTSGGTNLLGTLTSLLGSSGGSNLLGSLLGSLGGGGGAKKSGGGGFDLGGLLGGLTGGGNKQQSGGGGGFDIGSLLGGLTGGEQQSSPLGILGGFVSGSPLGQTNTRAASGMLVVNTLIQGAKKLLGKKSTKSTAKKSPAKKKSTTSRKTAKKSTAKKTTKKTTKKKTRR